MLSVLEGFAVIGAVILVGLALGRSEVLGPHGQQILAKLVFYAGTPALLYTTIAKADLSAVFNSALLATGGSALLVGLILFLITRFVCRKHAGDSALAGLAGSYVNIGNLGIPIAVYVLGDIGYVAPVMLFQLIILAPIGMAVLDATAPRTGRIRWYNPVLILVKNPILIGAVLGVAASATNIDPPQFVQDPIELLSGLAVPGVLIAFGISLKDGWSLPPHGTRLQLSAITIGKLVLQPILAWVIGGPLLGYTGADLLAIVVTSALPTAQNIYIYAIQYRRSEEVSRDAIFITTALSIPTLLLVAALLG